MSDSPAPAPSSHFSAHRSALSDAAKHGPILDLASGRGRHALEVARMGLRSVALDRSAELLAELRARAARQDLVVSAIRANLEGLGAIPLRPSSFGAVLVFSYLHRPLCEAIGRLLAPGGLLLYETFTTRQRELGWGPRSADFLLMPDELPELFPQLDILEHEEGLTDERHPRESARLIARRPGGRTRC